jgi:hypothetical protein
VYRIASFSLHQLYLAGSVPLIDLPKSTVLTHQRFYDTLYAEIHLKFEEEKMAAIFWRSSF